MDHEVRIAALEKNFEHLAVIVGKLVGISESSQRHMEMLLVVIERLQIGKDR